MQIVNLLPVDHIVDFILEVAALDWKSGTPCETTVVPLRNIGTFPTEGTARYAARACTPGASLIYVSLLHTLAATHTLAGELQPHTLAATHTCFVSHTLSFEPLVGPSTISLVCC